MRDPLRKPLTRRYLLWAYKTTRESFERIERKTTQLVVDEFIAPRIARPPVALTAQGKAEYARLVEEFDAYIKAKKADELKLKYDGNKGVHSAQYAYLKARLAAIEAAVVKMLGSKVLKEFEALFEGEFTRRILEAREH